MDIETIKPQEALSKYIDFYYFIKSDSDDFSSVHYSYPHTVNAVSIYKSATYQSSPGAICVHANGDGGFLTILQGKRQSPVCVRLSGKIDRISIFFKPLGLNVFMAGSMADAMGGSTNEFLRWNKQQDYSQCLEQCFANHDLQQRINVLEGFLLDCLIPGSYPKIELALEMMADLDGNHGIGAIAQRVQLPLRSFNRQFREMIGVSPIQYKIIVRFRNSLNDKLFSQQFKRLTDIGYNSNFYDQAYFVKIYRKLTGLNPAAFFREVEKLGDQQLIFRLVKS